jgi:hypothetical protein
MKTLRFVSLLAIVAVLLLAGATARGQNTFEYGVDLSVENAVVTDRVVNANSAPVEMNIDNPPWGTASGKSFVAPGVNKAASSLHLASSATAPLQIGYANAYAYWYDRVTISEPNLNGTPGTFTASMLVNGTGDVTAAGPWMLDPTTEMYAVWHAFIGVFVDEVLQEEGWYGYWERNEVTNQLEYSGAPLGQIQTELTFEFIYGEPFTLSGRLQTYMDLFNPETSDGTFDGALDLGNSAYWAGITRLRDANGQTVTGASITSLSGVQWGSAINPGVLRGDFDDNGIVDLDDFNILAAHFGGGVTPWTLGDATGDGIVNLNDFNILAANFGMPASTGGNAPSSDEWAALAGAIPEPGATPLLALLACTLARRRRRGV